MISQNLYVTIYLIEIPLQYNILCCIADHIQYGTVRK